jgi:hypothetical protein
MTFFELGFILVQLIVQVFIPNSLKTLPKKMKKNIIKFLYLNKALLFCNLRY